MRRELCNIQYKEHAKKPPVLLGVPKPVGPSYPVVALHIMVPQLPLLPVVASCELLLVNLV
jgi:hypothetical protein